MESRIESRILGRWMAVCVAAGLVWGVTVGHAAQPTVTGPSLAAAPTLTSSPVPDPTLTAGQSLAPVPQGPPPRSRNPEQAAVAGTCPCMPELSDTCCPDYCCASRRTSTGGWTSPESCSAAIHGATWITSQPWPTTTRGRAARLSTSSLDNPFKGGVELSIGHTFKEIPFQIEVSYLSLDSFDSTATYRSPTANLNSLFTTFGTDPSVITPFDTNHFAQIHEFSRFETQELNLRQIICMPTACLSCCLIYGVRHVSLNEEFDYNTANTTSGATVGVTTIARNDLWGPQVGHSWVNFPPISTAGST